LKPAPHEAAQRRHEIAEAVRPDIGGPFSLNLKQRRMDDLDHPPSPGCQIDPATLAFPLRSPLEVTQRFELPDDVIGRLPRHAKPPREVRWSHPVGGREAEDGEMGGLQVGEPRGLEVGFDPGPHVFETLPQQRANIRRAFIAHGVGAE
jgi:hypothetical protein